MSMGLSCGWVGGAGKMLVLHPGKTVVVAGMLWFAGGSACINCDGKLRWGWDGGHRIVTCEPQKKVATNDP